MRNERGPKRTGRSGSTGYKGKSSGSDSKKSGGYKKSSSPKKYSKSTTDSGKDFKKTTGPKKYGTGFKKDSDSSFSRSPYKKKFGAGKDIDDKGDKKPFGKKPFGEKDFTKDKKSFSSKSPYKKKYPAKDNADTPDRKSFEKKPFGEKKADGYRSTKKSGSYADYKKKGSDSSFAERKEFKKKTGIKTYVDKKDGEKTYTKSTEIVRKKDASKGFKKVKIYNKSKEDDGLIRLNKFIANAGICSRREADTFIQTGVVTVNGVIITELGYKVKPDDRVLFHDKPIIGEQPVYILLNKPKDYITTSKDPQNRKTIYELMKGVKERVFPIGRLDRNTTGVLLLTNDGQLAEKLMHPRKGVPKIYHVELDKKFTAPDMEQIRKGIELEDGFFQPDVVDYAEGMDKHHVGIEIHSGKNRIVRRLFEALEYKVIKLDRVVYAGLTKKGLTRGKWRFLKDSELHMLKMM